jgi:hypothetical protein
MRSLFGRYSAGRLFLCCQKHPCQPWCPLVLRQSLSGLAITQAFDCFAKRSWTPYQSVIWSSVTSIE